MKYNSIRELHAAFEVKVVSIHTSHEQKIWEKRVFYAGAIAYAGLMQIMAEVLDEEEANEFLTKLDSEIKEWTLREAMQNLILNIQSNPTH